MNKKQLMMLLVALVVIGGAYYYVYRDSFTKPSIQISHTIRPGPWAYRRGAKPPQGEPMDVITFRMDHAYALTSVKVVSIPELETNKYAHPLWELNTDSNSVPVPAFYYGMRIRGMKPAVKGSEPAELTPNVPYRLFVQAGKIKGEHDFTLTDEEHLAH